MSRTWRFNATLNFPRNRYLQMLFASLISKRTWCVGATGESLGFVKSEKIGLPTAPIGILGVLPETRRPGVKPSHCCTCEFKCNARDASYYCQSTGRIFIFLLLSLMRCTISLKSIRRPPVPPKLRRCPGITACTSAFWHIRNLENSLPTNLASLSAKKKISGFPENAIF